MNRKRTHLQLVEPAPTECSREENLAAARAILEQLFRIADAGEPIDDGTCIECGRTTGRYLLGRMELCLHCLRRRTRAREQLES